LSEQFSRMIPAAAAAQIADCLDVRRRHKAL